MTERHQKQRVPESEIIIYQAEDGRSRVEVRLENETVKNRNGGGAGNLCATRVLLEKGFSAFAENDYNNENRLTFDIRSV